MGFSMVFPWFPPSVGRWPCPGPRSWNGSRVWTPMRWLGKWHSESRPCRSGFSKSDEWEFMWILGILFGWILKIPPFFKKKSEFTKQIINTHHVLHASCCEDNLVRATDRVRDWGTQGASGSFFMWWLSLRGGENPHPPSSTYIQQFIEGIPVFDQFLLFLFTKEQGFGHLWTISDCRASSGQVVLGSGEALPDRSEGLLRARGRSLAREVFPMVFLSYFWDYLLVI